jgi:hypothetical protein
MDNNNHPSFATWSHGVLAKFASDCYMRLKEEQQANEQLRLDLKDAMKLLRAALKENDNG